MSDGDLLAKATRALREETRDDDSGARFTRSRVMASALEERVRYRTRLAFLIPLAATFLAASAWGAANGTLGRAVSVLSQAIGFAPAPAELPKTPEPPRAKPAPKTEPALEPAAPPAPQPPVLEAPPSPAPPAPQNPATSGGAPPRASNGVGGAASDPAFELYRAAHQAHFVERDSARALQAWNAYLKAAPNAALSLEARYNRALCLVRLRRTTEARAALEPFAQGRHGGYRKAEAAELILALPPERAGPDATGQ